VQKASAQLLTCDMKEDMIRQRICDLEQAIAQFLADECSQGRFESTIPDIMKGIEASRTDVATPLARLEERGVVEFRVRGNKKYYHLAQLKRVWQTGRRDSDG